MIVIVRVYVCKMKGERMRHRTLRIETSVYERRVCNNCLI